MKKTLRSLLALALLVPFFASDFNDAQAVEGPEKVLQTCLPQCIFSPTK